VRKTEITILTAAAGRMNAAAGTGIIRKRKEGNSDETDWLL
jgi:hypothetical protein